MRALIAWSKDPANAAVLGDIGAIKSVSRAMRSSDPKLVASALMMLRELLPQHRWNGLSASAKEAVLNECLDRSRSARSSLTLAKIYEALQAAPRPVERRRSLVDHMHNVADIQYMDTATQSMVSPILQLLFTHEKGYDLVFKFMDKLLFCPASDTRDVGSVALKKVVGIAMAPRGSDKASDAALQALACLLRRRVDFDGGMELLVCVCDIAIENWVEVFEQATEKQKLSASDERAIALLGMLLNEPSHRGRSVQVTDPRLLRPLLKLLHVAGTGTLRGPMWNQQSSRSWLLFLLRHLAGIDDASTSVACSEVVTLVDIMRTSLDKMERESACELVIICVSHQQEALLLAMEAGMVDAFEAILRGSIFPSSYEWCTQVLMEALASVGTAEVLRDMERVVQLVADIAMGHDPRGEFASDPTPWWIDLKGMSVGAVSILESLTQVFDTYGDFGMVDKCVSTLQLTTTTSDKELEDTACRVARILQGLAASRRCCAAIAASGAPMTLVELMCRSPSPQKAFVQAIGVLAERDATLRDIMSTDQCLRTLLAMGRSGDDYDADCAGMHTLVVLLSKDPAGVQRLILLESDLLECCVEILYLWCNDDRFLRLSSFSAC